jgi:uncharacterized membrane protein (UPF0127 family)
VWATRFGQLPRLKIGSQTVPVATGVRSRLLGLTLLDRADTGPGLLIPRCAAVHTFGMRFALDLHFFDGTGAILAVHRAVPPRRFVRCRGAVAVLEVPAPGRPCAPAAGRRGSRDQPKKETYPMDTYVILRRKGWASVPDLEAAAARSTQVGDEEMSDDIRWIRSYVLDEGDGAVGTVCIYQASSPEAIREHASRAGLPADEIIPVADTVLVRPDPEPAAG